MKDKKKSEKEAYYADLLELFSQLLAYPIYRSQTLKEIDMAYKSGYISVAQAAGLRAACEALTTERRQ